MKLRAFIGLTPLIAASCSFPVMFAVDVDEPIAGGTLTLNGRSARLKKNMDGRYWAKWNGSDAGGKIDILYPDGGKASCRIGYVTHGMGIQNFSVSKRICRWTATTDG